MTEKEIHDMLERLLFQASGALDAAVVFSAYSQVEGLQEEIIMIQSRISTLRECVNHKIEEIEWREHDEEDEPSFADDY